MSIIPVTVPTGAIRYNTDSNKMECFNGTKWYEISVSSPDLDGGARGLFAGGNISHPTTATNVIQYITIPTAGNAIDFGDLTVARFGVEACGSRTRGVFMGGRTPTPKDEIDYVTISSLGNATDFGNLQAVRQMSGTCSNATRGLNIAGNDHPSPNVYNSIDYITIASTGNAQDFGDTTGTLYGFGCTATASPTRGVYAGAYGAGTNNTIEYVTISTLGNGFDFGDLVKKTYSLVACSNSTRGLLAGGSPGYTTIGYITIATLGDATDFGALSDGRFEFGATASSVRGVFGGGIEPSKLDIIDYVNIATAGDAVDFGNLTAATQGCAGTSNAHGGL